MKEKEAETVVVARGLCKRYGRFRALDNVNFTVERGKIIGLIGPNGAGKTTVLKSLLGLTSFEGELSVLGLNPCKDRHKLMQNVCFIADVAVLPKWLNVEKALAFVEGVHHNFKRKKAEAFLAKTQIRKHSKVGHLSKGMVVQLHLALVLAIEVELLVLDEPTLGLDILFRKEFYHILLNEFFDQRRSIIVTTHQVEEVETLLSDVLFIQQGRIVLNASMQSLSQRFTQVKVSEEKAELARNLSPVAEREIFGGKVFLFDGVDSIKAGQLGEVCKPALSDIFVATLRESA